jgi:DNA-binding GntR family transcriptional regulator
MPSNSAPTHATSSDRSLSHLISQSNTGAEEAASIPEKLARTMREMILQGQLRPGDPLVESRMARDLSVGQPTVREAFKALELEGLVERTRNRGCSVVKLGQEEVDAMSRLRVEVEVMAVKELCRSWSDPGQHAKRRFVWGRAGLLAC